LNYIVIVKLYNDAGVAERKFRMRNIVEIMQVNGQLLELY